MRHLIVTFIIILANVNFVLGQKKSKVIFDFSGLESFVELCNSPNVEIEDIDKLLNLPAYQGMINWLNKNWWVEINEEVFRNFFQATFLPEKYAISEKFKRFKRLSNHLAWAKQNHLQIEEYINVMKPKLNSDKIINRVTPFLPNHIADHEFLVYFVVGLTQGSASKDGIFIDSKYQINSEDPDKYLNPWIAHELHHSWRELIVNKQEVNDSTLNGVAQVLYWLESEGIAEMVGFIHNDLESYVKEEKI